jgi:hypothetical protein
MRTHRLRSLGPAGGADDLLELLHRVEREGAHSERIGFGDRLLGLDRVHEALDGPGQGLGDEAHLGDRRDVVMSHAAFPQDAQQVRRRIGLDRIERAARKLLDKEAGGAHCGVRTNERDRLDRSQGGR